MAKARKTGLVMYGTYSNVVEYEYRGKTYDVEYAKGMSYCCTSPRIQHENAQREIDERLNNSKPSGKAIDIDEIYEMMGWD